jgi:hypothetical protein
MQRLLIYLFVNPFTHFLLVMFSACNVFCSDFEPRPAAFSRMKEIVHGHFDGVWTSVSEVDKDTRKMWFEEFQVLLIYFFSLISMY